MKLTKDARQVLELLREKVHKNFKKKSEQTEGVGKTKNIRC